MNRIFRPGFVCAILVLMVSTGCVAAPTKSSTVAKVVSTQQAHEVAGKPQHLVMKKLGIFAPRAGLENQKNPNLLASQSDVAIANFNVQVADTFATREIGLMFRTDMPANEGMIFLFEKAKSLNFWMKNTLIPLDIIFIDKDWKIFSIQKNVQPCKKDPCPDYPSNGIGKYVLEINAGLSDRLGIESGTQVALMNN